MRQSLGCTASKRHTGSLPSSTESCPSSPGAPCRMQHQWLNWHGTLPFFFSSITDSSVTPLVEEMQLIKQKAYSFILNPKVHLPNFYSTKPGITMANIKKKRKERASMTNQNQASVDLPAHICHTLPLHSDRSSTNYKQQTSPFTVTPFLPLGPKTQC